MRTAASIPRRPDRLPRAWLLAVLLVAAGCAAGEREQGKTKPDKAEQGKADVVATKTPAASRAAEDAPGPAPADPAPAPTHLDRASLRVLGMT